MSTIAELEIPAKEFALSATFDAVPDAEFEVERVVAYERDRLLPFTWATADESGREALDEALRSDPSVGEFEVLADLEDEWLYRMDWVRAIDLVVHVLLEEQATVLTAFGEHDRWLLRVLFPDRDALSQSYDFCERKGLSVEMTSIYELDQRRSGQFGLTADQLESLVTAAEMGYYSVPREATLKAVAAELGISHQALSERLRRGHGRLVRNALVIGTDSDDVLR
jgi:predicted DNA binding protein